MSLNKDVSEAIEKNLPSMVAKELKDYLKEAEELKEANTKLNLTLEVREERIKALANTVNEKETQISNLKAELALFKARELDFDRADGRVTDACHKEEVARAQYDTALLVVDKFLRNTIIRENIQEHKTENQTIPGPNGYGHQTVPQSQYYNKSRTEERTSEG